MDSFHYVRYPPPSTCTHRSTTTAPSPASFPSQPFMRFLVHNRHASLIFSILVVVVLCAQSCAILGDPIDYSLPGSSGPWDFLGKNIGECCHFLLQGFFPTQGSNSHLLYPLHWPADFFYHCATREALF